MPSCQAVLLEIMPRIISFQKTFVGDPRTFKSLYVNPLPMYHCAALCTGKYPPAFFTIGLLFIHRPQEMKEVLDQLILNIQNLLSSAAQK